MNVSEIKILFLGLDGSGKSTIIANLKEFKENEVREVYPTPFLNCSKINFEGKKINCIEISGLKRYRKTWSKFYDEVDGIIFVIDGTDPKRMKVVKDAIFDLDKDLNKYMPISFLINKSDKDKCLTTDQVKDIIGLDRALTNFGFKLITSVAYEGTGIKEAIDFICTEIIQQ